MGKSFHSSTNWSQYNKSLISRGSLTFWADAAAMNNWFHHDHTGASELVSGMHGAVFAVSEMLVFTLLGLVVPSSSGLAVLSMPIMAPLADTVMIPRYIVVSAYNWGQYAMLFLAPTGLVLVTLQMLGIQFNQWVKFVLPMVGFVLGFGALMLVVQVMMI
jgi:uncharacterized ion transporter superfamily protein YfcC